MISYRIAYDRFILAAKKKNAKDGFTNNAKISSLGEGELHHILPRKLGGTNSFKNLVLLSHNEHIYAHMLLNLALAQEGKLDDLRKLSYFTVLDSMHETLDKKHALKHLKIDVYVSGKKWPPMTMSLHEAAKHMCFVTRKNYLSKIALNDMKHKIFMHAMHIKPFAGYKMKFNFS